MEVGKVSRRMVLTALGFCCGLRRDVSGKSGESTIPLN